MRISPSLAGVLLGGILASAAAARAPVATSPDARELLAGIADLTAAEWAAVEAGTALAKVLDTGSREIAVVGVVRIGGGRDALIGHLRDVTALKRSAIVLDAGRFGDTPSVADLQGVSMDDHNLYLRDCRPGDCRVRLNATDIARFHRDVNWSGADWRMTSAAVWREVLVDRVKDYRSRGLRGLPEYVNKPEPLSVQSELAGLLREFSFVARYSQELHGYLQHLGPAVPRGVERLLYWTKEDFGIRPIVRITDQIVQHAASPTVSLLVTNQVYADHYLDAALGVTLAMDAPGGCYMVAVNRARTRSLSGVLRRFARSRVETRSRDAMRNILTKARAAVEGARRR
jgi:hypothetical protein